MILTDFHVHSDVSLDSRASMWDMVQAEAAAGVALMCFTNHCDIVRWQNFKPNPRCREIVPESIEKLDALRREHPLPLEVLLGIELAEAPEDPALAARLAAHPALDFVLGSLHARPEFGDFFIQDYASPAQCHCYFDLYLESVQAVAELDFYDVLAHIGYPRRYMFRRGIDAAMTLDKYGERIAHLLRTVIGKGKGVEINCSGIRDGCGPFPSAEILALYRDLGGEIVTVGSDAHSPEKAALCVREGTQLLKALGFPYVTIFRHRTPEFIKL